MDQLSLDKIHQFLSVLFRSGEFTCYSKRASGTTIFPVESPPAWVQFFSINPMYGHHDVEGQADPGDGRRADANCTAYRNILIECDTIPLEEQIPYIEGSGVPWSTCVYSGGKSFHFIVSLEQGYETREQYEHAVYWMHSILTKADHSTKNPSRLSRFPEVLRVDKDQYQELMEIRGRTTREQFDGWLARFPDSEPVKYDPTAAGALQQGEVGYMSRRTRKFLMEGAPAGERNASLYLAARDLLQQGWSEELAIPMLLDSLRNTNDFDERKSLGTIAQAFKKPAKHPPRLTPFTHPPEEVE